MPASAEQIKGYLTDLGATSGLIGPQLRIYCVMNIPFYDLSHCAIPSDVVRQKLDNMEAEIGIFATEIRRKLRELDDANPPLPF